MKYYIAIHSKAWINKLQKKLQDLIKIKFWKKFDNV